MFKIPHDHGIQLQIGEQLARGMAAANVLGRLSIVKSVGRKTGKNLPLATSTRQHLHFAEGDDGTVDLGMNFDLHLPGDDAAAYIRGLNPVTRETFDGLTAQYRKLSFTLAGTADTRLIQKVRDALADVAQRGGLQSDFDAAVAKITSDAGVEQVNAFTIDTAFQIAMAKAHSVGRYEQLTDEDTKSVIPFWEYLTAGDDKVRAAHAALDHFQANADDPVWNKIYPPWDFGCRCIVIGLLPEEASDEARDGGLERLPARSRLALAVDNFTRVF